MNKIMRVFGIIGILAVTSVLGYLIFKFALGLLVGIIVAVGFVLGFYFCVLFPPKSLKKRLNPEKYKDNV